MSQFDRERLDALVADGWLRSQRHPHADLWIYNYTEKTQYESHWTPETLVCRGLILDQVGNVVARPFSKFFNYGSPQAASIPVEPFVVMEKMDGSLGILYYLDGQPRIATRGNFTSEQAIEGTAMIREHELERVDGVTALFEILYPANGDCHRRSPEHSLQGGLVGLYPSGRPQRGPVNAEYRSLRDSGSRHSRCPRNGRAQRREANRRLCQYSRSEEHTSELQSLR